VPNPCILGSLSLLLIQPPKSPPTLSTLWGDMEIRWRSKSPSQLLNNHLLEGTEGAMGTTTQTNLPLQPRKRWVLQCSLRGQRIDQNLLLFPIPNQEGNHHLQTSGFVSFILFSNQFLIELNRPPMDGSRKSPIGFTPPSMNNHSKPTPPPRSFMNQPQGGQQLGNFPPSKPTPPMPIGGRNSPPLPNSRPPPPIGGRGPPSIPSKQPPFPPTRNIGRSSPPPAPSSGTRNMTGGGGGLLGQIQQGTNLKQTRV